MSLGAGASEAQHSVLLRFNTFKANFLIWYKIKGLASFFLYVDWFFDEETLLCPLSYILTLFDDHLIIGGKISLEFCSVM